MFIGICGGTKTGKSTIAEYLVATANFTRLTLAPPSPSLPTITKTAAAAATDADSNTPKSPPHFPTADSLLAFVTTNWRGRWVTTDLWTRDVVVLFARRPFFLLVHVEAPVLVRFARAQAVRRLQKTRGRVTEDADADGDEDEDERDSGAMGALSAFLAASDRVYFGSAAGAAGGTGATDTAACSPLALAQISTHAHMRLLNSGASLSRLHAALDAVDLTDETRLRPTWDSYFMQLADLAAQRSNCMKRVVGCVLVRDRRVVSTGYNGTPRGMRNCGEGGCPRCNAAERAGSALDTCLCLHAEENALLEAGRERVGQGATLYCNTCPCLTCSVKIAQVGISEVVYSNDYSVDSMAAVIFKESGVKLRQFTPPTTGLIDLSTI